jgi:hypothetical protein
MVSLYQSVLEKPPSGTTIHSGLMWDTAGDTPRLQVPRDPALRTLTLVHCHDDIIGAHFSRDNTLAAAGGEEDRDVGGWSEG